MNETIIHSISQRQVKELLRKRIFNPNEFIGRPLIIWRSYYFDGIQEHLVKEVLKEHNEGLPNEQMKGVLVNPKKAKKERLTFVAIDTLADYESTLANFYGIPFVVYAAMPSPDESILADFPNADQYIFSPDYKEWSEEFASHRKSERFLLDFISHATDDNAEATDYLWYNYFNTGCKRRLMVNGIKPDENTGCDFPSCWQLALSRLRMAMKMASVKKIYEVKEDVFNLVFPPGISKDLISEFRNYIMNNRI